MVLLPWNVKWLSQHWVKWYKAPGTNHFDQFCLHVVQLTSSNFMSVHWNKLWCLVNGIGHWYNWLWCSRILEVYSFRSLHDKLFACLTIFEIMKGMTKWILDGQSSGHSMIRVKGRASHKFSKWKFKTREGIKIYLRKWIWNSLQGWPPAQQICRNNYPKGSKAQLLTSAM